MTYNDENIFAKILNRDIPCESVFEDDHVLSFKDINPQAKLHILIIPKKKFNDITDFLENADSEYQSSFWYSVNKIIKKLNLTEKGFQLNRIKVKMAVKKCFTSISIYFLILNYLA